MNHSAKPLNQNFSKEGNSYHKTLADRKLLPYQLINKFSKVLRKNDIEIIGRYYFGKMKSLLPGLDIKTTFASSHLWEYILERRGSKHFHQVGYE